MSDVTHVIRLNRAGDVAPWHVARRERDSERVVSACHQIGTHGYNGDGPAAEATVIPYDQLPADACLCRSSKCGQLWPDDRSTP